MGAKHGLARRKTASGPCFRHCLGSSAFMDYVSSSLHQYKFDIKISFWPSRARLLQAARVLTMQYWQAFGLVSSVVLSSLKPWSWI